MKYSTVLLAGGYIIQGSAATFSDWRKAPNFSSPSLVNNKCVDQEKQGWKFDSVPDGPVKSFSSFSFDGFSCSGRKSKRDLLHKRGGQYDQKPIKGTVSKSSGPSFACGASDSFSIDQYDVTVDRDVDIEFEYTMGDGSSCSHVSRCSGSGTTIKNSQCGGAKKVTFKLPEKESGDCGINIHEVKFDCGPSEKPPAPQQGSSVVSPSPSSSPKIDTPSSVAVSVPPSSSSVALASSSTTSTLASHSQSPIPDSYSVIGSSSVLESPSALNSSPVSGPSSVPGISSIPGSSSIPKQSSALGQSSVLGQSSQQASLVFSSTIPPRVSPSQQSKPDSSALVSSSIPSKSTEISSPVPTSDCPDLLPQCLNTWMFKTSCKDNTDIDCFCNDKNFIGEAYGCLSAWGKTDTEIQAAVSFLVGICAKFIPANPAIITECPTSIPIVAPVPASTPAPAVVPVKTPAGQTVTTKVVITRITTCSVGETVSSGTITTVLATPSVSTVTLTSTSTTVICNEACSQEAAATPPPPPPPTTPAPAPPPVAKLTTITVDKTVTNQCTYSTGSAIGQVIPSSFTTQVIATTVTVPQVAFAPASASGSTGIVLIPGPSPVADAGATTTPFPTSTLVPSSYPRGNATASSVPEQFLGSAEKTSLSKLAMGIVIIVALMAC